MKTFILKNFTNTIWVEVKVDAFCKNDDFLEPGFDTRFTNMEIVTSEVATVAGVDLKQIENRFRALVELAENLDLGLYVVDINKDNSLVEIIAAPEPPTIESIEFNVVNPLTLGVDVQSDDLVVTVTYSDESEETFTPTLNPENFTVAGLTLTGDSVSSDSIGGGTVTFTLGEESEVLEVTVEE